MRAQMGVGLSVLALVVACATAPPPTPDGPEGLRAAADLDSDPRRRASTLLAARAEEARIHGEAEAARSGAESALRLDSRNPYAYLVLARTLAEVGDRDGALRMAAEAETRFRSEPGTHEATTGIWVVRATRLRQALEKRVPPVPPYGAMPGTGPDSVIEPDP